MCSQVVGNLLLYFLLLSGGSSSTQHRWCGGGGRGRGGSSSSIVQHIDGDAAAAVAYASSLRHYHYSMLALFALLMCTRCFCLKRVHSSWAFQCHTGVRVCPLEEGHSTNCIKRLGTAGACSALSVVNAAASLLCCQLLAAVAVLVGLSTAHRALLSLSWWKAAVCRAHMPRGGCFHQLYCNQQQALRLCCPSCYGGGGASCGRWTRAHCCCLPTVPQHR